MAENVLPLVSIAIPTFNRADGYLQEALASAVAQSWRDIEIVVADNCSTDRTDELVAQFDDPRIRYFRHSHNIGPNNNFNFCLEKSRGKYFLLLHDDDLIDNDFVETCMRSLSPGQDVGIVRTGTRSIDADGQVIKEKENQVGGLSLEEFFLGWFDGRTALYLCSTLFNTKHLKEIGGFKSKTNLFQDVVAEFKLAEKYGRIDIPDVKASFRKHEETITHTAKVKDWCEDSIMLLDLMNSLSREKKDIVNSRGRYYLAQTNYRRANLIQSLPKRFSAYFLVCKMFGFKDLPKSNLVFPGIKFFRLSRLKNLVNLGQKG